jgi:ribonuclease HI
MGINNTKKEITIYTDGGCKKPGGLGAWAAILIYQNTIKEISGINLIATNNQMELEGPIQSLSLLKYPCNVTLYTDSMYVVNGGTTWRHTWKKNNWILSSKKNSPVKNLNQWLKLDNLLNIHNVTFKWCKGHSGIEYNERCDSICTSLMNNTTCL